MRRLAPLLALTALLAAPALADAATVSVVGGQLRFVAASGERNGSGIELADTGEYRVWANDLKLTAGQGCTQAAGGSEARCPGTGVTSIAISLGDRDDGFNIGEIPVPLTLSGGTGKDQVSYFREDAVPLAITADDQPNDGPAGRDNIASDIEWLFGGPFADTLQIGPGGGTVIGREGDDRLTGGAGPDLIEAAYVEDVGTDSGSFYRHGTDTIKCGAGQDFVLADSTDKIDPDCDAVGKDVPSGGFEFMGSNGPDRISVRYGWSPSVVFGRGGDDLLITSFAGAQRIVGGAGNDRIQGGGTYFSPAQRLEGGSGNDRIRARDPGKGWRDVIICGPGRDHAIVDRRDSVSGCERVSRSR
jgi:serralysin